MHHTALQGSEEHTLRYECAETSVGRLLVVISEHGVVDVILGDSLHEMLSRATNASRTQVSSPIGGFTRTGSPQW